MYCETHQNESKSSKTKHTEKLLLDHTTRQGKSSPLKNLAGETILQFHTEFRQACRARSELRFQPALVFAVHSPGPVPQLIALRGGEEGRPRRVPVTHPANHRPYEGFVLKLRLWELGETLGDRAILVGTAASVVENQSWISIHLFRIL